MKVLIVEDSPEVVKSLNLCFKVSSPEIEVVSTSQGAQAIELVETEAPDVVILDLGLPDMDGIDVLKEIRRFSDTPVIILTVKDTEMDRVSGLDAGADDYITKPFSPLDLLARVRAVLRRHRGEWAEETPPFVAGNLVVNFDSRQVLLGGKPVNLTPTEHSLLCYLVRHRNRVASHRSILRDVWGEGYDVNSLKTYIAQLRRKLQDTGAGATRMIVSVRGVGYKFAMRQG